MVLPQAFLHTQLLQNLLRRLYSYLVWVILVSQDDDTHVFCRHKGDVGTEAAGSAGFVDEDVFAGL